MATSRRSVSLPTVKTSGDGPRVTRAVPARRSPRNGSGHHSQIRNRQR